MTIPESRPASAVPLCRHREDCRLCQSKNVAVALPLGPSPLADQYIPASLLKQPQPSFPLDLYLCLDCGHAQVLDVIDPEVLFRHYIYESATSSPGLVEHFKKYSEQVLYRLRPPRGSLAVDIGSNDGTLLRFFQKAGLKTLGIDPAQEVAAKATASGIRTIPVFFTSEVGRKLAAEEGPAALVTANNAFAHSDELADMADGVREMLAPNGVFVFEVSYVADLVAGRVFDFIYHEHLCHHSVKPLRTFLSRHGLQLFDVERLPIKGGSLRCFAQKAGGPHDTRPAVAQLMALEAEMKLDQLEPYQALSATLDGLRSRLLVLLAQSRAAGRKIAGYGASATTTTLLHHFELAPYVEFLVDDNAGRQGLFSPGLHLPVVAPEQLYERKVNDVLVMAWRYYQPIVAAHRRFTDAGGRFILPLPELKVLP